MFKVQRFTAEDDEEAGGSGNVDDSTNILNKVLERARARASAKRARLGPSSDGVQHQAAASAPPLERKSGTESALNSAGGVGREGTGVSTGGQSLTGGGDSIKDRAGRAVQEEGGGTSEDDGDSSEDEGSSSGESSSEGEGSGDSGEEEKDAEILPTADHQATAGGGGGDDQHADGQGLRPMEEVAQEWGLDPRLSETLREEGVEHFFPIQV